MATLCRRPRHEARESQVKYRRSIGAQASRGPQAGSLLGVPCCLHAVRCRNDSRQDACAPSRFSDVGLAQHVTLPYNQTQLTQTD
jgi:hypothetical protein